MNVGLTEILGVIAGWLLAELLKRLFYRLTHRCIRCGEKLQNYKDSPYTYYEYKRWCSTHGDRC